MADVLAHITGTVWKIEVQVGSEGRRGARPHHPSSR